MAALLDVLAFVCLVAAFVTCELPGYGVCSVGLATILRSMGRSME